MMNFSSYGGGYNGYQYNPYLTPQQRITQYEAQYPQYNQTQTTQPPMGFKTIPVSNVEEANATPADMSGNPIFFFNKAKGEIYLKQLNLQNGEAYFQTFKLVLTPLSEENAPQSVNISDKQYKALTDKLDALQLMLANRETEQPRKEIRNNAK